MEASDYAGFFAEKIGLKNVGQVLGLLHDLGKASSTFQNYILSAIGFKNPDEDNYVDVGELKGKIDHSSAGAQLINQLLTERGKSGNLSGQIISLCIASHHSGLIDCISPEGENIFTKRINKPDDFTHFYESYTFMEPFLQPRLNSLLEKKVDFQMVEKIRSLLEKNESGQNLDSQETIQFKHGLLIRYLFSCLIDADRLSTADFETPENKEFRNNGKKPPWYELLDRLDLRLSEFDSKDTKNVVNEIRKQVSEACFDF